MNTPRINSGPAGWRSGVGGHADASPLLVEQPLLTHGSDGLGIAARQGPDVSQAIFVEEAAPPPRSAKVVSVYDGDTVTLSTGDKVRVLNVNTPERRPLEPLALEARAATEELVLGKRVKLRYPANRVREHYGRLLATVETPEGDLSENLIRRGLGHVFLLGDDSDPEPLLAAQREAREAKRGIWALPEFQKELYITSFHANGRGKDADNPNVEYFRMVNISEHPINLEGYTVTNEAGRKFTLPAVEVAPGRSVVIASGQADDPEGGAAIHLGSSEPIWNNEGDTLTLRNPAGEIVIERDYAGQPLHLDRLPNPVSQARVRRLGLDVDVTYRAPRAIPVRSFTVDDGDTIFFPQPAPGVFQVRINDVERDVVIADQRDTPEGKLAVRFVGVDTPETHVEGKDDDGNPIVAGQGAPGRLAKKALAGLLREAVKVEVVPHSERPFDVYDRLLGTVWATVKDGDRTTRINVNRWLIEQGHGEMVVYYGPEFDERAFKDLRRASRQAVRNGRGIYGDGPQRLDERPSDFRRRIQRRPPAQMYVADWETKKVYPVSRIDEVPPYNRIFISPPRLREAMADLGLEKA